MKCPSHYKIRYSEMDNFKEALTYGTYYPISWHHYPHLGEKAVVVCDKCRKQPLKRCIGFKDLDLCLTCASAVEATMDIKPVYAPVTTLDGMTTYMAPEPYYPQRPQRLLSRMAPYDRRRSNGK